MMDTAMAAGAVGGSIIGACVPFVRVTTDTRALAPGDLFVALRGERFDGHDFVAQAIAAGAAAAIVERTRAASLPGNLIAVDDPLRSLGALARYWRARFAIPVAGVAGSNGKTTTKEMTASIFRAAAGPDATASTPGNFNNAIGLPLALLALRPVHRLAVFEIGMNHRGETRELADILQPTIAVVTNAQREHQEFMRSVDEVAAEHADLVRALPRDGVAVVDADDPRSSVWRDAAAARNARVLDFALDGTASVTARHAAHDEGSALDLVTPLGNARVMLHVPGRHMARNALAAVAAAIGAGVPLTAIVQGLEAFRPVRGRLATLTTPTGARVIDDTYNANPDSVRAAIDVLAARAAPRVLILGDMGEVGTEGPEFHREIGRYAKQAGIERLLAAGVQARESVTAFGAGAEHFDDVDALATRAVSSMPANATVLVKGSRFMRMERVVAALTGTATGASH
jgi:UDP-N-acetylmuramoyl-tripeptide--D-alanyl-D-alanine ligase